MTNEDNNKEEVVEVEEVEEQEEEVEEEEEAEKPKESLQDKESRLERQLSQTRKKMGKDTPKAKSKQSDEFDNGDYAYLEQKGIESDEDIQFVKDRMEDSGKNMRDTLNAGWFKAELKERQELAVTTEATPKGSGAKGSAIDSVEYWLGKEDAEIQKDGPKGMLLKVVNARVAKEGNKGHFYNS